MAQKAKYRRCENNQWTTYYFETDATQVVTSFSGTNYLNNSNNAKDALEALDTAVKNAADSIPSGVLTTINYATTLDNAYLKLAGGTMSGNIVMGSNYIEFAGGVITSNGTSNANLSIGSNSNIFLNPDEKVYYGSTAGTDGANEIVKKSDLSSYVPTTRTINNKALSSNITLYGTDIAMSSSDATTVKAAIDAVASAANGISKSIVIAASGSDVSTLGSAYANTAFNTTNASVEITATSSTNYKLKDLNGNDINLEDLNLGDTVFILDTNVPDRWLADIGTSGSNHVYTFAQLETYNMQWGAIAGKPTTIAGYGITDASIDTTTKVITLGTSNNSPVTISPVTGIAVGGNTLTPSNGTVTLPAYPDISGLVPYSNAGNNVDLGNHSLTANNITIKNAGTTTCLGTGTSVDGSITFEGTKNIFFEPGQSSTGYCYIGSSATESNKIATKGDIPVVTVGSTQPSNPSAGAIWFDTSTN